MLLFLYPTAAAPRGWLEEVRAAGVPYEWVTPADILQSPFFFLLVHLWDGRTREASPVVTLVPSAAAFKPNVQNAAEK